MLSLEIITRTGRALFEEDLVEVVFRRREERFDQGSEVAIFRGHAPLLMQNAGGEIRWRDKKDALRRERVDPGLVEVLEDHVLVVTDAAVPCPD